MIGLVVTDMDNTLYSWTFYIVPAVEALMEVVCRATGFPRIKVIQSLKAVYERYESNEYPYVLQESSLFTELPEFGSFDKLIIQPAKAAFAEARRRYLKPYPRVLETLQELGRRNVPVVALTDAPRNPAEQRAKLLGVDVHLAALYTLPGFQFPEWKGERLIAEQIARRDERGLYRAKCEVVELPRDHEKPDSRGLVEICRRFGVDPKDTLVVGDSLRKDVALARAVGAVDCWAEYGTYVPEEYLERLNVVSARSITRRHAASVVDRDSDQPPETATHSLSNFWQLLSILDARR
ncbi:MAG TPA: HAD family hydrolase [Myxococcales bacterium]|jgi:phosphoglycolate phosphatase|nr:HAD family hydrolase [Myxococcales bacterium]